MQDMLPENIQLVLQSEDLVERETVMAVPYEFFMGTRARWEMLISDEEVEVRSGEVKQIAIQKTFIPKNTIAVPCAFGHHDLGVVLKVRNKGLALIEAERPLGMVQFLAFRDGRVHEGDLLGMINVFSMSVPQGMERPC